MQKKFFSVFFSRVAGIFIQKKNGPYHSGLLTPERSAGSAEPPQASAERQHRQGSSQMGEEPRPQAKGGMGTKLPSLGRKNVPFLRYPEREADAAWAGQAVHLQDAG